MHANNEKVENVGVSPKGNENTKKYQMYTEQKYRTQKGGKQKMQAC